MRIALVICALLTGCFSSQGGGQSGGSAGDPSSLPADYQEFSVTATVLQPGDDLHSCKTIPSEPWPECQPSFTPTTDQEDPCAYSIGFCTRDDAINVEVSLPDGDGYRAEISLGEGVVYMYTACGQRKSLVLIYDPGNACD